MRRPGDADDNRVPAGAAHWGEPDTAQARVVVQTYEELLLDSLGSVTVGSHGGGTGLTSPSPVVWGLPSPSPASSVASSVDSAVASELA